MSITGEKKSNFNKLSKICKHFQLKYNQNKYRTVNSLSAKSIAFAVNGIILSQGSVNVHIDNKKMIKRLKLEYICI